MLFGQDIHEYTGQLALVIDAGQFCAGSAGYVNLGKSAMREDKPRYLDMLLSFQLASAFGSRLRRRGETTPLHT